MPILTCKCNVRIIYEYIRKLQVYVSPNDYKNNLSVSRNRILTILPEEIDQGIE